MPQNPSDRRFRTPYWPVAYTVYANDYWRAILVSINGNGRIELSLYEPSSHASVATKPLSSKATESDLEFARGELMSISPRDGQGVLPESAWVRCPIKPMAELCRAQRGSHFYAQFFSLGSDGALQICTFRGNGVAVMSREDHHILGDPTCELGLGDSTRRPDPSAPRDLIRLQNGSGSTRTQVCPQNVLHDLSRLMPEDTGPMGVSTRVRGSGVLAF